MNISDIHNYIIEAFQNDPMVNTVSLKGDSNKENIYPLVTLKLKRIGRQDTDDRFVFDIGVYQQRDKVGEINTSKLMEQDNYLDNLNDCQSIANRFIDKVQRLDVDSNITVDFSGFDIDTVFDGANLDGLTFEGTFVTTHTGYCNE